MERFRGGLVFKAHRLLFHSALGSRVIKKKVMVTARDDSGDNRLRAPATYSSSCSCPCSCSSSCSSSFSSSCALFLSSLKLTSLCDDGQHPLRFVLERPHGACYHRTTEAGAGPTSNVPGATGYSNQHFIFSITVETGPKRPLNKK